MSYQESYPQLANSSRNTKSQQTTLEDLSLYVGYLGSSITLLSRQIGSESLSIETTLSTHLYKSFLLTAKLLKLLCQLRSQTGIRGLTCSLKITREVCGKKSETVVIDGLTTDNQLPVENFEQLELDLFPGMP